MSVRLAYLERSLRGGLVRGVRVFGVKAEQRWPGSDAATDVDTPEGAEAWIARGAAWLGEQLAGTRSAGRLEMLCLDADGATCGWLAARGADPSALAALARLGPASLAEGPEEGEGAAVGSLAFFAGDARDSTVQALAPAHEPPSEATGPAGPGLLARRGAKGAGAEPAGRVGVMAGCDVSARVFVDALDEQGVSVSRVTTIWHVLAQAWDPASPLASRRVEGERVVAQSDEACAVVMVEAPGTDEQRVPRLVWCWSRRGEPIAAGTLRLAMARDQGESGLDLGRSQAARLAAEWLAWSLQLGAAPRRVICVVPEDLGGPGQASEFGRALAGAFPGAAVDAAAHPDPLGATFERLAAALEGTPDGAVAQMGSLAELSARPGHAHRTMYAWVALMVIVASAVMGVVAWQVRRTALDTRSAAAVWRAQGFEAVKRALPNEFDEKVGAVRGQSPLLYLEGEIRKRERDLVPPTSVEPARAILDEIEAISLVVGTEDFTLDELTVDSGLPAVRLVVQTKELTTAERVVDSLHRIAGSHVDHWGEPTYVEIPDPKGGKRYKATLLAYWPSASGGGT